MASEPTEAAMREAEEIVGGCPVHKEKPRQDECAMCYHGHAIALALDAARRKGMEEAEKVVRNSVRRVPLPADPRDDSDSDKNVRIIYLMVDQAADKIRALREAGNVTTNREEKS